MRALIIGAGFGGLSAAKALRDTGVTDITILERSTDVGGVWRDNTYPGAACDVPSDLYSWSWAPHAGWRRRYGTQTEIFAYIRRTAQEQGFTDLVRFGAQVDRLEWDAEQATWTATLADGSTETADLVVTAVGQLSNPRLPDIPGHETFAGPAMHTATWDHSVDLTGKRVVCVGTGASAIQAVPRIAPAAEHTTVLQRTPPYVVPKPDTEYGAAAYLARRDDRVIKAARSTVFWVTEVFNQALVGDRRVDDAVIRAIRTSWWLHLRRSVSDPALRKALTPDYPIGCKRLLFSSEWYPTLDRDDVDLVTEGVTGVEPEGVRLADGRLVEADVLVWGTGFAATDFLAGIEVVGAEGVKLHDDVWDDGAWAHLGVTVPGFPNLFMIYGPNTNLGGSSIITMLEAQAGYAAQVARRIAEGRADAYEVREHVARHYDTEMQERLNDSVWNACTSWYNDGSRITTNWPGIVEEYVDRLAEVDESDLVAHHPAAARARD
ncbi:NAD(P)/FAD-dependent oxidoreductase [Nocardioidaceae bacterium]|nr:NAD(P)/FAD-dependent oxidoreductase [Nocardioidaceae bacterium]